MADGAWQERWVSDCGTATLYLADALALLPSFKTAAFGAAIFDPPYGIQHETNHGASWEGTQIVGDGDTSTRDAILSWCNGHLPWACFGSWKIPTPDNARGVLVWDKGPAFGMGDLSFPWKASWEEIAIGGPGWSGSRDEGVVRGHIVVSWESKGRVHPHQKPESLISYLLGKLPDNRAVIDPTMGSGTTGVACVRAARPFIGIDIDPRSFELARGRIEAELGRFPLFPDPPPAQRGLFAEKEETR